MTEIARRVINVSPDQVIGPPRRKRTRTPKHEPMGDPVNWGSWFETVQMEDPPTAPTQQGFGHFDRIAREMKR